MAGRAHRAKSIVQLAIDDGIGGGDRGPCGPPSRRSGAGASQGVGVERAGITGGFQLVQEIIQRRHVVALVGQAQVGQFGQRRFVLRHQGIQALGTQVVGDGQQALGTLRVTVAHVVGQAIWMGEITGRHGSVPRGVVRRFGLR